MNKFEEWWMMESKIPYRDKKEIARTAWDTALDIAKKEIHEDACPEDEQGTNDALGSISRCYSSAD